jgi:sugar-specific transcriptional regulator TrmB
VGRPGSDLLDLLAQHGVPEKGARVYLAACRAGPQTASELARLSAVSRVEAYRFIKQLRADGLLQATGGRPTHFAAMPPNELLDRWIRKASERVRRMEQDRHKILTDWEDARTDLDERDPRKFAVLEGRETIHRFLVKRLGTAEHSVFLSASGSALPSVIDVGTDRALREAHARGVKVRIVTEVYPQNLVDAKHLASFAELRHSAGPIMNRSVVIDRVGSLVYVSGEEGFGRSGEEQVALWSSAPMFVQLARDYHRRLWGPAEHSESRFVQIENPSTAVLPVVRGQESVPFQRLKEIAALGMRAAGVHEFEFQLPELIELIARQLGREIAGEVEGDTPEAVGKSLGEYYESRTMGHLKVLRQKPLTFQVTGCFACTSDSPEIGRVMCPQMLRTVLENRIGKRWEVSKPDPTKHASRGCVFTATPA